MRHAVRFAALQRVVSLLPPANANVHAPCAVQFSCIRCVSCVARARVPWAFQCADALRGATSMHSVCVRARRPRASRGRFNAQMPCAVQFFMHSTRACVSPARVWWSFPYYGLISRSTRTGSGQTGAQNGHFLITSLSAGAPELALPRLGLRMVIFSLRAY